MSTLQKYILVSAVFLLYLTSVPAQGQINVLEYFPLNIGDVFTYDDGSRAEITRTVELDWLDNVTAYEKVWTVIPNPEFTDARNYFILSGDSLFLAWVHFTKDGVADQAKFDPPALMGTANTTPGDTLTTLWITLYGGGDGVEDDSSIVQVVVNRSGPVSVPYGTFEDCITMTITLIQSDEEETVEILNVILAKGIGIIQGMEVLIATASAPVHSMTGFQGGATPHPDEPIDVTAYMPLNIGDVFTYDDGSRAEITRTVELDWLDNVTGYEKVWTNIPIPQVTDFRQYFIISGDSLFSASIHYTYEGVSDYFRFDPPTLLGTANTTPGDTLTTVSVNYTADTMPDDTLTAFTTQVVLNWSDPVSVPYGTFEDCITMTVIEVEVGEPNKESNQILAKGIGIIHGQLSASTPVHSMTDFQQGVTPVVEPEIALSITSIEMGEVTFGSQGTASFSITNSGNAPLAINSITSDNSAFTVSPTSATISAGDTLMVTITFSPAVTGSQNATITVASNDSDESTLTLTVAGSGGGDLIDVPAYMPLNIGDVFTYDDGSRAEITRTVELDWLDNVTAYEKLWTVNPNPDVTDVRYYFIISGDSLFWASVHLTHDNFADYAKFDPPILMGTANTSPGDTLTTVGIWHEIEDATGLPEVYSSFFQVVVNRSGPVSVPYGTFEDCITMTFIEEYDGEMVEVMKLILAKGIGIIYGREEGIATELAPVHSLSDFQPGVTPVVGPEIALSITSIEMGEVTFGSQGTASFSITNSGNAPLAINSITSDNSAFTVSLTSATIAAGDSLLVTVTYTPSATGSDSASITLASDDPDSPTIIIPVSVNVIPLITLPKVTAISPSYLYQEAVDSVITVTGENFSPGARVTISGGGILVTETGFIDSQNLSAKVTVSAGAVSGSRDVSVVNPDGETGTGVSLLEVRELPKVLEIKPFYLEQGTDSLYLTINGKGFTQDFSASFSGSGVSVISLEYKGPYQVIALISADNNAAPGRRELLLIVSGIQVAFPAALEIKTNLPPEIDVAANWSISEGEQLTFVVQARDPEGGPLTYQTGPLPAGASFQGLAFTWRPDYDQAGTYAVQFTVADRLGATDQETVNITVVDRNRAPRFYKLANQKTTAGQTLAFEITAGDPDGAQLELTAAGLPTGASITRATDTTFTFSWTPSEDDAGTFRTEFTVTDPAGATDRLRVALTVEVTATPVNLPPLFKDTVSTILWEEGGSLDLTVQTEDPNGDPVVVYAGYMPQNADFDPATGRFTFRPDYTQSGGYTFRFVATDGSLSASRDLTVQVTDKDVPPIIFPISDLEVSEGERLSFVVAAVDSGGDALSYEADSLPLGAFLDPLTGTFIFAPNHNQAGSYSIPVRVKDPTGNTAETTVTITVKNANQPPRLTFIPNQFVQPEERLELLVSALDPDGDALSYDFTSTEITDTLFNSATQVLTFIAGAQPDTLQGLFIVSDPSGEADSQLVTFAIVPPDNLPPVIVEVAEQFYLEGDAVKIQITASDPDGEALTYTIQNADQLPQRMHQIDQQGLYSFVADHTMAGRYEVIVQVSDGTLFTNVQLVINLEDVNRPPVLESVGDLQVAEGEQLDFNFVASDPDGDTISYEMISLPRGANFDIKTRHFRFTPDYDQADTLYLGVIVSDGRASATENFRLVVTNTNRPPILRRVKDPVVEEGGLLEFEMEADDPDGDSAWVVVDTTKVPFLGEAMQEMANIRNGRSFFFNTGKLIDILRIPSAVLKFYAVDEHGARSPEEVVDISVIRKILAQIKDLPPGLEKKLDFLDDYGVGVKIAIMNNSDITFSADIEVHEQSGRLKGGKKENSLLLSGLLEPEDRDKHRVYSSYLVPYLSAAGEEKAFYGIRRGWGLDLSQLPSLIGITAIFTYQDEDLPLEIEGFDESNLRLYGLDTLSGRFVKIENAVVDTDSNTVTFQITDFSVVDYTLGVEVSPEAAADVQTLNVEILVDNVTIETGYTTDTTGPYVIRAYASEEALVSHARLFYRIDGTGDYQAVDMSKIEGERYGYEAQIEGLPEEGTIQYYVEMFVNFEMVSSPLNPEEQTYELIVGSFLIGDVSGNGIVNIFDLLDMLKVLSGSLESTPASDCDQNGIVNIFDLLDLLRILGGR